MAKGRCARSSMDRMTDSGSVDKGSIPFGRTPLLDVIFTFGA